MQCHPQGKEGLERTTQSDYIAFISGAFGVKKTPEFGEKINQPGLGKRTKDAIGKEI